MKLGNIFEDNTLTITQSLHGILQLFTAFDFVNNPLEVIAPTGYKNWNIERVYGQGRYKGFHLVSENKRVDILYHHAIPYKTGKVKAGDKIGKSAWHHFHVSIKVDGKWHWITDYLKRSIDLKWAYNAPSKWDDWATYPVSLHLPETSRIVKVSVNVLNIRLKPNTKSKVLGQLAKNEKIRAYNLVSGEKVGKNDKWIKIKYNKKSAYIWSGGVSGDLNF